MWFKVVSIYVDVYRFLPMSTHVEVDSCSCRLVSISISTIDDFCQYRSMSIRCRLTIIDYYRCRFWSMSTHVDVSSGQLRLMSMTVQVDVDNCYCRHSVYEVVQWIQLILVTSCDLRLGPTAYDSLRWMWITRTPSHFIGQEEIINYGLHVLQYFYSDAYSIYIAISIISLWQLVLL